MLLPWLLQQPKCPLHCLLSLPALLFCAVFALVVAWPTFWLQTYMKWRIPILSVLRVSLIALPFNFSTLVFDAIAPHAGAGRLAVVSNVFQLFLGERQPGG